MSSLEATAKGEGRRIVGSDEAKISAVIVVLRKGSDVEITFINEAQLLVTGGRALCAIVQPFFYAKQKKRANELLGQPLSFVTGPRETGSGVACQTSLLNYHN